MLCNLFIATVLQLAFWCLGYLFGGLTGALIGVFLATVIGCGIHCRAYLNSTRR